MPVQGPNAAREKPQYQKRHEQDEQPSLPDQGCNGAFLRKPGAEQRGVIRAGLYLAYSAFATEPEAATRQLVPGRRSHPSGFDSAVFDPTRLSSTVSSAEPSPSQATSRLVHIGRAGSG